MTDNDNRKRKANQLGDSQDQLGATSVIEYQESNSGEHEVDDIEKNNSNDANGSSSSRETNHFANDGSFLANFLAQQAATTKTTNPGTAPQATESKKTTSSPSIKLSNSSPEPSSQQPQSKRQKTEAKKKEEEEEACVDENDDEESIRAKEEFLQAMRIMEEAGLVTEKGIGAGMVK